MEEERFETLEYQILKENYKKKDKIANTDTRKYNYKQKQKIQIQKITTHSILIVGEEIFKTLEYIYLKKYV